MQTYDADRLIHHIYEASYQPERWSEVLEGIAGVTQSRSAVLGYRDNEVKHASLAYIYNIDPVQALRYNEAGEDPHFQLFTNAAPLGTGLTAQQVVPDRQALERIYGDTFNQLLTENDIHYVAGVVLFNDVNRSVAIGLQRGRADGPWPDGLMDNLTGLSPHIQRSLHIHKEFTRLRSREQALFAGLDRLLIGLILFDELRQPIYCNPVAEAILRYHPAIRMHNDQLRATSIEDTEAIQRALTRAIDARQDRNNDPRQFTTALGLRHRDVVTPLPMLITPVGGAGLGLQTDTLHGHAAVLISDPERNQPIVPEALVTAYGLTPAEAQVAIAIANGLGVDETAELHNTKISTVKSQLKAIFRKLGVSRQAELVKILLTGPFRVNF